MGFSKGDKVTCNAEYTYDGRTHLSSYVRSNVFEVIQVGGKNLPDDRIVIGKNGVVTAAVRASTLTNMSTPPTPVEPTPTVPPESPKKDPIDIDGIASKYVSDTGTSFNFEQSSVSGSVVKTPNGEKKSSMTQDDGLGFSNPNRQNNVYVQSAHASLLDRKHPSIIQNNFQFPVNKGLDRSAGYYRYDYYMDYERDGMLSGLGVGKDDAIRRASNIDIMSRASIQRCYANYYNKFKLMNGNDVLARTFAHVFFIRPDCNIYETTHLGNLASNLDGLSEFYYASKHAPDVLRQLTQSGAGFNHEFMMLLSNRAESFEVSDEYIETVDHGTSMTGFKVPYGKSNVASRTAGKFSIMYHETRDLHIYQLHQLWMNYISYVYRGKIYPKDHYILNKVLDYPTCVYYILTAEDGETIIFWSKYWGVFPLEAPSSTFSYNLQNAGGITNPEMRIEYQYAWKEDFNPLALIEFNAHSDGIPFQYVPNYQASKLGTGYTWSGPPFIETRNASHNLEIPYTFKLRFRKK